MEEREEDIIETLERLLCSLGNGGSILYSEENSIKTKEFVGTWEKVFQHGFKAAPSTYNGSIFFQSSDLSAADVSWWPLVQGLLSKDEVERISKRFKSVNTQMGWARSWLRIALNERSLKRILQSIDKKSVEAFFEPWALLRTPGSLERLIRFSDLTESRLKFALLVDHPDLNQSTKQNDLEDFIVAQVAPEPPRSSQNHKKSKKRRNQVVCLDEVNDNLDSSKSISNHSNDQESSDDPPLLYSPRLTPIKNVEIGALTPIKYDTLHSSSECNSSGKDDDEDDFEDYKSNKSIASSERDELKSHLLSVLDSKEELCNQVSSLKLLLESENRKVSSLRNELDSLRRTSREKEEKKDARIGTLARENELLKHQLKKYVGAVQRLQDGPKALEIFSKLEKDGSHDHLKQSSACYIDYHYEASEYEKKLVQVAEMHGELLEFNESLQKSLNSKENLLRRYREELILLRGPIECEGAEDGISSVVEQLDIESTESCSRAPLINIWIPSVFLSGTPTCNPSSSSKHHVYQVYLRIRDEEWNVYRRYSEFYALNKRLKRQESTVGSFDFPPKKSLGYKTEKVVEDRKARLQTYLRKVVNLMAKKNSSLADNPSKSTLTGLIPFFQEHRVSRNFDSETEASSVSPSIFSRSQSTPTGSNSAVPQLAL